MSMPQPPCAGCVSRSRPLVMRRPDGTLHQAEPVCQDILSRSPNESV